MGVVYFLCDQDRGEAFELGKGWHLERVDEDSAYWPPSESLFVCLGILREGLFFLREGELSDLDHDYARRAAARLWLWLLEDLRDQARLSVRDDCGSDVFCRFKLEGWHYPETCGDLCLPEPGARHYFVTGTRYDSPDGWAEANSARVAALAEKLSGT